MQTFFSLLSDFYIDNSDSCSIVLLVEIHFQCFHLKLFQLQNYCSHYSSLNVMELVTMLVHWSV